MICPGAKGGRGPHEGLGGGFRGAREIIRPGAKEGKRPRKGCGGGASLRKRHGLPRCGGWQRAERRVWRQDALVQGGSFAPVQRMAAGRAKAAGVDHSEQEETLALVQRMAQGGANASGVDHLE